MRLVCYLLKEWQKTQNDIIQSNGTVFMTDVGNTIVETPNQETLAYDS
jgi:hypothetical protein